MGDRMCFYQGPKRPRLGILSKRLPSEDREPLFRADARIQRTLHACSRVLTFHQSRESARQENSGAEPVSTNCRTLTELEQLGLPANLNIGITSCLSAIQEPNFHRSGKLTGSANSP
jgi:hypothetical protein